MNLWAAQWHSKTKMEGETKYIMYEDCLPKVFHTRQACREWIEKDYGYIAKRPDLRVEPHGWRMPRAVKITIKVTVLEEK